MSPESDRLAHAAEVEGEIQERRVAADHARKPWHEKILGGGRRHVALATLAENLLQERRLAAARGACDFHDHGRSFMSVSPGRRYWKCCLGGSPCALSRHAAPR